MWGVGVSHEMGNVAGAETVESVEGNTCVLAMQEASSRRVEGHTRTKRSRWNLGDLVSPAIAIGGPGPRQEARVGEAAAEEARRDGA